MSDTTTESATETSGGVDLDSVLAAAWDQAEAATPADGPQRDERGRFASTRTEEASATAGTEAEDTPSTDQPEAKTDEPAQPAIEPPQSWSDAEKAHWATLSREAQDVILRRERDVEKGFAERAAELKDLAPLRDVLAPYRSKHAMMGLSDAEAVGRLLAAEQQLRTDPDRAFVELARAYGYDLRRLGVNPTSQQQQPANQEYHDPRVDRLLQEMQQREQRETLATIESFAKDPAHPHFEDVRSEMGALIAANPAMSLQDAYDRAAWGNPATRTKVLEAERKATAEKQRQEAAAKAEAARKAGVSVRDRAPSGGANARSTGRSLEEELEAAWGDLA